MTAPIASGWSESPGGPRTHWKAPPFHRARRFQPFARPRSNRVVRPTAAVGSVPRRQTSSVRRCRRKNTGAAKLFTPEDERRARRGDRWWPKVTVACRPRERICPEALGLRRHNPRCGTLNSVGVGWISGFVTKGRDGGRMQDRLSGLDGLRGIAASAVLVCHIAAAFCFVHGGNVPQWLASGKFGVQVFFVLSGFVILMTIERCASPGTFLASRFARLFPAYWAAIAIAAALGLWCPGEFPNVSSKLVAANFTMLQRFLGLPPLDWSYWTLPCELVF